MSLRSLIPVAVFAAFALFISRRRRSAAGSLAASVFWSAVFAASLAGLTWWVFEALELFPMLFALVYSLVVWGRERSPSPTRWDRVVFSRWSPLAASLVLTTAEFALTRRFDFLPVGFSLLPLVSFPLDRGRVRAFVLSGWSLAALGLFLIAVELSFPRRFDPQLPLYFVIIGTVALASPDVLRFPPERRKPWFHPAIFGLLTLLAVGWVWGSLDPVPAVHDEASYLLQARLFAHGQWQAASPPLPEFFEQFHVLLTPAMASKYLPGHALLLAAGIRTGFPALVPLLLTGLTGALFFELARRLSNTGVALFAWLLWIGSPRNLDYRATYLNEVTTSLLWLAGWWFLLRWKENRRVRDLAWLGACVAWGAITRPLTMVAFAIPALVIVLRLVAFRRAWRDLAAAALPGAAILCILPLWNQRTTGDWRVSPLQLYTRQYMPYDIPGFGPGASRQTRELPTDLDRLNKILEHHKDIHTVSRLPTILAARAWMIEKGLFGSGADFLLVFLWVGLFHLTAAGAVAFATGMLLVLLYLTYWHIHVWGAYYLELYPAVCLVTALGIWRVLSIIASRLSERKGSPESAGVLTSRLATLLAGVLIALAVVRIPVLRSDRREKDEAQDRFRARLRMIGEPAIVFVRYEPYHDIHRGLVQNEDDLERTRVWVVHDRGADNERLLRLFPDRRPYLYDEAHRSLRAMTSGRVLAPRGLR